MPDTDPGTRPRPGPGARVFDQHRNDWVAWQETPWARLRYRLVGRILSTVVDGFDGPCRVLDVGGGDGADSLPLAEQGHEVTIVDHSEALLARASAAAGAGGYADRVRTVHADITGFDGSGYDLVLCHNVLHYLADVPAAVRRLVSAARPGGTLSVLAPNPAMDVLAMAVRRTDPVAAAGLLDAPTVRSETFDHEMGRLDGDTAEQLLSAEGCRIGHRYGIRCVTDLIADDELKHDATFFAELEQLEFALCGREPYRRMARFWQLIATR